MAFSMPILLGLARSPSRCLRGLNFLILTRTTTTATTTAMITRRSTIPPIAPPKAGTVLADPMFSIAPLPVKGSVVSGSDIVGGLPVTVLAVVSTFGGSVVVKVCTTEVTGAVVVLGADGVENVVSISGVVGIACVVGCGGTSE